MSKATIIIDGAGVTASFNSVNITDIVSVKFCPLGSREVINLTTIDATSYEVGLLGDLVKCHDVVITKKSAPAADIAHTADNKTLIIGFKVGKSTSKTFTCWAQYLGTSKSQVRRAPTDGVNVDLTFGITNLNAALAETGPVIA